MTVNSNSKYGSFDQAHKNYHPHRIDLCDGKAQNREGQKLQDKARNPGDGFQTCHRGENDVRLQADPERARRATFIENELPDGIERVA